MADKRIRGAPKRLNWQDTTLPARFSRTGERVGRFLQKSSTILALDILAYVLLTGGGILLADNIERTPEAWPSSLWQWKSTYVVLAGFALFVAQKLLSLNLGNSIKALSAQLEAERTEARGMATTVARLESVIAASQKDYFAAWQEELQILADVLGFEATERISIYKHEGRRFVMLGRYSTNPHFAAPGRSEYPDDQGIIGEAWTRAQAQATLPDPREEGSYVAACARKGLAEQVVRDFKMKSRRLVAFRINGRGTQTPVAVVVFESTKRNSLRMTKMERIWSVEHVRIMRFLEKIKAGEPSPRLAKEAGF